MNTSQNDTPVVIVQNTIVLSETDGKDQEKKVDSVNQPKMTLIEDEKFLKESLYERLKRLCFPSNFMIDYNKEKVDAANNIYSKLLNISPDNIAALDELCKLAEEELDLNLLDEYQFNDLKNKINPQNFMNPYDSTKITLANDLYSKILQPGLNYSNFIIIKEAAKPLLDILQKKEDAKREQERIAEQKRIEQEKIAEQKRIEQEEKAAKIEQEKRNREWKRRCAVELAQRKREEQAEKDYKDGIRNTIIIVGILFIGIYLLCHYASPSEKPKETIQEESTISKQDNNSFYYEFPEYGFALNSPCEMENVSKYSNTKDNFLINYGGFTDKNDKQMLTFYQFIVSRCPIGYKDVPDFEQKADEYIKSRMYDGSFVNVKPVSVGYEGYSGYVGETTHQGYKQKGLIFRKENYVISLTIITNNNIDTKFNKFTNGFKTLK